MTDRERLTEAISRYERWTEDAPELEALVDAARAYRDLLANGQRVEWCEKHRSDGVPRLAHDPTTCWKAEFTKHLDAHDCRIVSRLLVPYPKEAENG